MPNNPVNITNVTPPRVPLTDVRTGLISREWYRFFLNMFQLVGQGQNQISLLDVQYGPPAGTSNPSDTGNPSIAPDPLPTELISDYAELQKQVYGLEMGRQPQLGTMSQLEQANIPWLTFATSPQSVPTTVGTMAWDGDTTMGLQATANVLIRIGESEYVYAKASSAITKGQLCYHTGAVGASGVITVAPTPLALSDPNQIIGVAAESIALNGFGLIQVSGVLRGFNTTGSSVGETWADGDPLYYNPTYVGSMTKNKPSAPNQKTYIGEVINAATAGSGSMSIRVIPGSVLGGTDSNVQFSTLANNDLIQYDSALGYWKNVPSTTVGVTSFSAGTTGFTPSTASSGAVTLAGTLKVSNGGTGVTTTPANGQLLIGNGTNYTVANLTAGSGVTITNSAGGISISATGTGGTVTSVGLSMPTEFTVSNSPVTGSGTLTAAWNSQTANYFLAAPNGSPGAPTFRAIVAADVPTLNQNTTGSAGSAANLTGGTISGNYTVANATSPNTYYLLFGDSTGWTYRFMTSVAGTPTTRFSFTDGGNFTAVGSVTGSSFSGAGTGLTGTASSLSIGGNAATATTATSAGTATSATTATNIAGGAAGSVPYQTGAGATSLLAIGSAYQALQVNAGGTAPSWQPSASSVLTAQGDLLYASAANTLARLAKSATATRYLANTGSSNNPAWDQINLSNGVTGTLGTSNGGTGLTSFTANGIVYASSTSALATNSNIYYNGTTLVASGKASYFDPAATSTGGLNIYASYSYNDNNANTIGGSFNQAFSIIHVNTSAGFTSIPLFPNAGAGVNYAWVYLDPDNATWTYATAGATITFTQAGTGGNTFSIVLASGSGTATIQRTAGSQAYTAYIQRLAA